MTRGFIVFYVEDDDAAIRLVEKTLQRDPFPAKLIYFKQGGVFLDFLAQYSAVPRDPDQDVIVLLNMNLPAMHGTTVLEAIRQSPDAWVRQLPVIIFTSSDAPEDQTKCELLGCTAYLQKSFEDDRLIQAIQKVDSEKAYISG